MAAHFDIFRKVDWKFSIEICFSWITVLCCYLFPVDILERLPYTYWFIDARANEIKFLLPAQKRAYNLIKQIPENESIFCVLWLDLNAG